MGGGAGALGWGLAMTLLRRGTQPRAGTGRTACRDVGLVCTRVGMPGSPDLAATWGRGEDEAGTRRAARVGGAGCRARGCSEDASRGREDGGEEGRERTHLEPPDSWRRRALAVVTVLARCSAWLSMRRGERRVGTGRTWEWVVFLLASWVCCVRGRLGRRVNRLSVCRTYSNRAAQSSQRARRKVM
jgi:hypothetical protein